MLLDTSKARITVPAVRGTPTVACGRATAEQQDDERGEEQQRRQVPAEAGQRVARQPGGGERVASVRRCSQRYASDAVPTPTSDGDREHHGILEAHARLRFDRRTMSTSASARSSSVLTRWAATPARRIAAVTA